MKAKKNIGRMLMIAGTLAVLTFTALFTPMTTGTASADTPLKPGFGCQKGVKVGGFTFDAAYDPKLGKCTVIKTPTGVGGGQRCPDGYAQESASSSRCLKDPQPLSEIGQGGNPTGGGDETEPDPCPVSPQALMRWAYCPVFEGMNLLTGGIDYFINTYMTTGNAIYKDTVDTKGTKDTGDDVKVENYYKTAWGTFRNFGIGLVIIAGLVMLVSEAMGWQIVDAYTVRRVLPRLFLAIVLISISWELTRYVVGFFDDLGMSLGSIIYSSFGAPKEGINIAATLGANFIVGAGAVGYAWVMLGPLGLLSLLGTLLLGMILAAMILVARQGIIIFLVLISPLALAAYVLPNTADWTKKWWGLFVNMLLLYPAAIGLIALCKVLGNLTLTNTKDSSPHEVLFSTIVGILIWFAGYALCVALPRFLGGGIATLAGAFNDRGKGAFDRLKNQRAEIGADRVQRAKDGRGGWMGANVAGAAMRRVSTPGGLSMSARGRAKYQANEKRHLRHVADEAIKEDNNFAAGNDEGNALAIRDGMTRGRFISEYSKMMQAKNPSMSAQVAERSAHDAMAEMESGYGAQMGSDAMALTAFKARAASNKGYNFGSLEANHQAMFTDAAMLKNRGILNTSDAAAIIKSNRDRTMQSGMGFGAVMGQIDTTANRLADPTVSHAPSALVTKAESEKLGNDVLFGSESGNIIRGRYEDVEALSPRLLQQVQDHATDATKTGDTHTFNRKLAHVANLYDELGRTSEQKQNIFGDKVMMKPITLPDGRTMSVREAVDGARGDNSFLEVRREYGNRREAEMNQPPPDGS